MILPWLVVGAPLGAAILRLTLALALDTLCEECVRAAAAKGGSHAKVVRRHAGPATLVSVVAYRYKPATGLLRVPYARQVATKQGGRDLGRSGGGAAAPRRRREQRSPLH
jgi:hypothetical protein